MGKPSPLIGVTDCPPGYTRDGTGACVPIFGFNPGGGGATLDSLLAELLIISQQLQDVQNELHIDIDAGGQTAQIEVFATIGTAASNPYLSSKKVKTGYFQNLSATDEITVARNAIGTVLATAGKGYIMNRATLAGQGGGTMPFSNTDLATFSFVTNNNSSQSMAAVYFY